MLSPAVASAAPFTPGNVVVVRVGDGTASLSNAATATFLLEYTPAGVLVQTIPLPTAAAGTNSILTNTGTSTSDAVLTRSVNGAYLVLTGYDAVVGTATLAATTSATNNRVIGRVAANGTVDTSTRLNDGFSGGNIRSAATVDGSSFYAIGSNSGVRYVPFANTGATATVALNTTAPTNNRAVGIYGGNLYVSSASGAFLGVSQVGTGLPTTASQTIISLPGFPTTASAPSQSPFAFYFADLSTTVAGVDVVYVADERTSVDGGIQKWSLVNGTWTLNGVITGATATANGAALRGVNGQTTGTTVSLIASGSSGLYVFSDNAGYNAAPSTTALPSPIATATANTAFRGVAFAPVVIASATLASQAMPGLTVAPNPATDRITVSLPKTGAATVALRDLTGRVVLVPAPLAADQQLRLPTSLAAGVYMLEVQQGSVSAVRRVQKN
ncbi:T9SS type A sorting domain-containing protein [Hymenobacter sp. B1770]|uniref:T9SS type A sorting domain-containing protein n=1 Tax=Hymenobacter sp. B1770 TaxID=1718788 RepID=UPI003CE9B358